MPTLPTSSESELAKGICLVGTYKKGQDIWEAIRNDLENILEAEWLIEHSGSFYKPLEGSEMPQVTGLPRS